jgi:hypothetical protein
MNSLKLFLAFGLGWMTVVSLSRGSGAEAGRVDGAPDQPALQSRANALRERITALEEAARSGLLSEKVVAPFEVVNQAGQRLFFVSPDREVEVYKAGKRIAVMSAGGGFGTLSVLSDSSKSWTALNPEGVQMNDNGQLRLHLGRDLTTGNYRLRFYSTAGKAVAGIGVSYETNGGSVIISKPTGEPRAWMFATNDGRGFVQIVGGYGNPIAKLTAADKRGGLLLLCNPNNCDPPMVAAGDENGLGLVATGPLYFESGLGLTGVPGSFLVGKKQ